MKIIYKFIRSDQIFVLISNKSDGIEIRVSVSFIHSGFYKDDKISKNDIAILRLDKEIKSSISNWPVCLSEEKFYPSDDESCISFGSTLNQFYGEKANNFKLKKLINCFQNV